MRIGETLVLSVDLKNCGQVAAEEIAQCYVRDLVGSVTRPVKELKSFRRVRLGPGEETILEFTLTSDDLAFHGRDMRMVVEPGEFRVWVGGSSQAELESAFRILSDG